LTWCATATTVAGTGNGGSQVTQIRDPWRVALDSTGAIYVADSYYNRISSWTIGSPIGTIMAGQVNGQSGSTLPYLNTPYGVCVDSNKNVYVADTTNHRVQLWTYGASSGATVAGTGKKNVIKIKRYFMMFLGSSGSLLTQLSSPNSVVLDSSTNTLYVADTGNHRILSFEPNVTTGVLVAGGAGAGTSSTQLSSPTDIYYDSSSRTLFIVNLGSHCVVRWVIGAFTWSLVAGIPGSTGTTPLTFNNPQGLTLDSAGNLYVADTSNHRIQFFRSGNVTGTTIAGTTSTAGASSSLLYGPRSVKVDSQFNLYVADTTNHRVQMFQRC